MLFAPAPKKSQPDPHFSPGYAAKSPRSFESVRRDWGWVMKRHNLGTPV
jgi:hypothetical protein